MHRKKKSQFYYIIIVIINALKHTRVHTQLTKNVHAL